MRPSISIKYLQENRSAHCSSVEQKGFQQLAARSPKRIIEITVELQTRCRTVRCPGKALRHYHGAAERHPLQRCRWVTKTSICSARWRSRFPL